MPVGLHQNAPGRQGSAVCRRSSQEPVLSQLDDDQDCNPDRDYILDKPGGQVAAQQGGEPGSRGMSAERADYGSDDPGDAADDQ